MCGGLAFDSPAWREELLMRWGGLPGVLVLLTACSGSAPDPTSSSSTSPAAQTGKIAFASIQGGPHEYIYLVNTDGSGLTKITHGPTFGDILPAWSPDGAKIAFVRIAPSGNKDIYVVSADGTNTVRLTTTAVFDGTPAWSPDGRTIALTRFTTQSADLWVMNSDGSGERQLTSGPELDEVPSWSPEGKLIVFERHPNAGIAENADLFTVSREGKHIVRLTQNAHARNPAWSPDGTKIAFWADSAGDPIEILDVSTGALTTLVKTDEITSVGKDCGVVPTWSPDGTEIAWSGCEQQPTDLYIMRADGTGLSAVPNTSGSSDPAWQP
jgi:TolB protein